MKNILVAEDDRSLRDGLVQSMSRSGYKVQVAQTGKDALEKIEKQVFDLVIAGHRVGGADGLEILRKARSTNAGTLVIVTGENGSGAVEAMKSGAFDYLQKPLSLEAFEMKIQRAMEHQRLVVRLSSMTEPLADPSDRYGLVGNSSSMREIFKVIDKVAASNATVLIQGETGTGKERVAEAIHRNSPRHDAAFVRMNCASLPDNLLESELFGHEKGAFTGADQMRIGRFEMANDGTLFLDEVGNMSANTQAKVLRAIQNQEFERLGGSRTIKVDVRIVAATNINLETAIKSFPLIGQACTIGDGRAYMTALIVLDPDVAPAWARSRGIEFASLADLATHPDVRAEVERCVEEANARFSQVEKIKRFAILGTEWPPDSDELTPTMKLKRRGVLAKYAEEIEQLYL